MQLTTEPVAAGNTSQVLPEFGRVNDVQKIFGVKRGILYRWINEGKIKSVCSLCYYLCYSLHLLPDWNLSYTLSYLRSLQRV